MHAWKYPDHEKAVARLCREIGFSQVSVSHEVSPLIKLVGRGDTTVVDAYLSPILSRYVRQVAGELGSAPTLDLRFGGDRPIAPRLMFMMSSGGLTAADLFQGKDALLSGPAGGVVGMVETAKLAGFEKVIGFDMGGTSTDVAHYDGEYERAFDTEVAGVRMRAPMMRIHTVAAGGGSILHYEAGRFRAGPDSAGANPGPACYRRGGPLAVTDANVMLGKLQPDFFPAIFGPGQDQPLDVEVVREKFAALAAEIGDGRTPEAVAEGFVTIAVENMANAIKKISVQRGYDVTEYLLNCFGGAGGQHACLVADALGMEAVLIHPFSGLLSAYGIGLAVGLRLAPAGAAASRSPKTRVHAIDELDRRRLRQAVLEELAAQGIAEDAVAGRPVLHIRYDGTDTALPVQLRARLDRHRRRRDFETAHKAQFGFVYDDKPMIVETVGVEGSDDRRAAAATSAISRSTDDRRKPVARRGKSSPTAPGTTPASSAASALKPGPQDRRPGADHREPTRPSSSSRAGRPRSPPRTTSSCAASRRSAAQAALGTEADPVMLEVFNNLFMSIAEQMGVTLQNTAYSVNIKERLDFSCAVFDRDGALVANAPHMPVHLGSMDRSVETIIRLNEGDIHPGDVFALNAPYNGGTHLPDITVVTPVFDDAGEDDPLLGRLARPPRRYRRHGARLDDAARHHRRRGRRAVRQFPHRRARPLPRGGAARRC